jgi:hypothetical protein
MSWRPLIVVVSFNNPMCDIEDKISRLGIYKLNMNLDHLEFVYAPELTPEHIKNSTLTLTGKLL